MYILLFFSFFFFFFCVFFFFVLLFSVLSQHMHRIESCTRVCRNAHVYTCIYIYMYVSLLCTRDTIVHASCTSTEIPPVPPTTHTYETCACEISHGTRASITYILCTCNKCYLVALSAAATRVHAYTLSAK